MLLSPLHLSAISMDLGDRQAPKTFTAGSVMLSMTSCAVTLSIQVVPADSELHRLITPGRCAASGTGTYAIGKATTSGATTVEQLLHSWKPVQVAPVGKMDP